MAGSNNHGRITNFAFRAVAVQVLLRAHHLRRHRGLARWSLHGLPTSDQRQKYLICALLHAPQHYVSSQKVAMMEAWVGRLGVGTV